MDLIQTQPICISIISNPNRFRLRTDFGQLLIQISSLWEVRIPCFVERGRYYLNPLNWRFRIRWNSISLFYKIGPLRRVYLCEPFLLLENENGFQVEWFYCLCNLRTLSEFPFPQERNIAFFHMTMEINQNLFCWGNLVIFFLFLRG